MGAILGLTFGLGLFLILRAFGPPAPPRVRRVSWRDRLAETLAQAGVEAVTPAAFQPTDSAPSFEIRASNCRTVPSVAAGPSGRCASTVYPPSRS